MMNIIKTSELKEGMRFDKPVYIDGNNLLVPPNIPLKQKDIDRLLRWEIQEVETEGNIIKEISKPIDLSEMNIQLSNIKIERDSSYSTWTNQLNEIFDDIKKKRLAVVGSNHQIIDSITKEMLDEIEKNPQEILKNIIRGQKDEEMLSLSALNCASISAIIAKAYKMPQFRIMQLITAALLHDSGMLRVPDEIISKKAKLSSDELQKIKLHTIYSYQIVLQELKYPEDISAIVLYHHEKWDGTGYPKNISGEAIPIGARILGVADAYEAMLNQRPYRDALIGYTAMKNILSDNGTHFDPNILKIFLQCFGIFPVGSYILLNNSMVGTVIAVNSNSPMRPQIKLLYNKNGDKVKKNAEIDLLENENLFILKAIDPKDLRET